MAGDLFRTNEKDLAKALLGRVLLVGTRRATIAEAVPFPRRDTEKPLYRALLDHGPGTVYTPRQYNSILFHVLAEGGGCVAIRAVDLGGSLIKGPGRVTEALGLTTPKNIGRLRELKSGELRLEMQVPPSEPPRQVKPAKAAAVRQSGLGQATLQKHMQRIAAAWMKVPAAKRPAFNQFVDGILQTCRTEAALERFLRESSG